jgi:hypothetical protein
MSYALTWDDIEQYPKLLEREPGAEANMVVVRPVQHLRIVVDGETFIALLHPHPEDFDGTWHAQDGDGTYVAFVATDAYNATEKALKIVAERKAALKPPATKKPRQRTRKPSEPHS